MEALKDVLKRNPNFALLGKSKLKLVTGKYNIPKKVIDDYFKSKELHQIYTKVKKVKGYKINDLPYSFQIDIILLTSYKKQNNGIDKMLMIIDILSRKLFAYPIKSGKMQDVMIAYKEFVEECGEKINSISGDDFFNNKEFNDFNAKEGIELRTNVAKDDHITNQGNVLGIIDRSVRTIKSYISKYMLENNNVKWTKFLPKIITLYNETPHKGVENKTPDEAYNDEEYLYDKYAQQEIYNEDLKESIPLQVGDSVRAMIKKNKFDKEKDNYSKTIYTIDSKKGNKIVLKDEANEIVKRKYRPSELLKVEDVNDRIKGNKIEEAKKDHKASTKIKKVHNEIDYVAPKPRKVKAKEKIVGYVVDKILKHKGVFGTPESEYLVKWEGYDDTENSWEPYKNVKKLDKFEEYITSLENKINRKNRSTK
jgi:hypothetical protein